LEEAQQLALEGGGEQDQMDFECNVIGAPINTFKALSKLKATFKA